MMPDALAAAALTFAASAHCLGMCGGFVLAVAGPVRAGRFGPLRDHVLLQVGKTASYAFLGALAGALGGRLAGAGSGWGVRTLAGVAALALLAAGLSLLGLRARGAGQLSALVDAAWQRAVAPLVAARPAGFPLVTGMAVGFLPCPLVYAGVAAAAASGGAAAGALILAGVGLGTVPALALVAVSGALLPARFRWALTRLAGVMLLAVGVMMMGRALGLRGGHPHGGPHPAPASGPASPAGHAH